MRKGEREPGRDKETEGRKEGKEGCGLKSVLPSREV